MGQIKLDDRRFQKGAFRNQKNWKDSFSNYEMRSRWRVSELSGPWKNRRFENNFRPGKLAHRVSKSCAPGTFGVNSIVYGLSPINSRGNDLWNAQRVSRCTTICRWGRKIVELIWIGWGLSDRQLRKSWARLIWYWALIRVWECIIGWRRWIGNNRKNWNFREMLSKKTCWAKQGLLERSTWDR